MIPTPRRFVCAGNLVMDILVRPVEEIRFGQTQWVDSIEQHMGGNGANTSYTLGKLGAPVELHGWVGQDAFGAEITARLLGAGVELSPLTSLESEGTATTVALVRAGGDRAFLHRPGVSWEAFSEPLAFAGQPGTHFHLANLFALPKLRLTGVDTLRAARAAGCSTSLDTGWDARGEWLGVLGPALNLVDLLFLNHEEGAMLTGESDEAAIANFLLQRGVGTVVMKLGARGCRVFDSVGDLTVSGFQVDAVDTTGAGDCFAGGFLAGLYHGLGIEGAARLANAVGALNVQALGSTAGVLSYADTLAWMQRQPA